MEIAGDFAVSKEFTCDVDGYPTEDTLSRITHWPMTDFIGLTEFIAPYFNKMGRIRKEGYTVYFATGGWSGNESIIHAMQENIMWKLRWISSHRGGKYGFELMKNENLTLEMHH